MTPERRAIVADLRKLAAYSQQGVEGPWPELSDEQQFAKANGAIRLAADLLEADGKRIADDAEPIKETWLRVLGGMVGESPAGFMFVDFDLYRDKDGWAILRIHSPHNDGVCTVDLFHSSAQRGSGGPDGRGGIGLINSDVRTHGDFRRLCEALGITLQEQACPTK